MHTPDPQPHGCTVGLLRRVHICLLYGAAATVTFTGMEEARVLRCAVKFRDSLLACMQQPDYRAETCTALGPAPCPVPKINYNYRYRLTLRLRMTRSMSRLLGHLLRQFSMDKECKGVTAFIDINGFD